MDNISSTPFFIHDCNKCQHLGSVILDGEKADLYFCKGDCYKDESSTEYNSTVISRLSDEGGDYHSGFSFGRRCFENPEDYKPKLKDGKELKFGAGTIGMGLAYFLAKTKGLI